MRSGNWLYLPATGLCAAYLWACGGSAHPSPRPAPATTDTAATPVSTNPLWPRFEDARGWSTVSRPFRTQHLTRPRLATLKVSPGAEAEYRQLVRGSEVPLGTALVEALAPSANAPVTAHLVMEKQAAGWRYFQLDADGRVVDRDSGGLCRRCHVEGLTDELFGPPRPLPSPATVE